MKHMFATMRRGACSVEAEEEKDLVHYGGCGLIGADTLCGQTDRTDFDWHDTNKRVNCKACLAVRDHVLGRAAISSHQRGNQGD